MFEEKPFELKAEFETAQAVVPGQGQTIRVAGVRIGDVADVALEDGRGVVTFEIERKYLPVYKDATILMRPTTGLKDMFFELDPGSSGSGEYEEGDTVPVANTAPDVNLDEILSAPRLRHPGVPEAADRRRRQGARGPRPRARQAARRARADQPRPRRAQLGGREAQGEPRPPDPQLQPADDDRRARRVRPDRAGLVLERRARGDRQAGPERPARGRLLPEHADPGDRDAQPHRRVRPGAGAGVRRPAPVRPQLDELNLSTRQLAESATPVLEDEIRPFVRAARAPGARPAPRRRALLGRDARR